MLQLKNINKRFGSKTVAQDINLNVEAGEILAVLGRSGCGKSTLLKTIVGLVRPDSGEVWLNGDNITDMPSEKRNISLMFQDYALLPHLTALDNVGFGLKMRCLPKAEIEEQSMQALRDIGLEHEAQRKPESLSGGEQQRLALARALITRPSLLLLDEAFSSLDTHLRHHLRTLTARTHPQSKHPRHPRDPLRRTKPAQWPTPSPSCTKAASSNTARRKPLSAAPSTPKPPYCSVWPTPATHATSPNTPSDRPERHSRPHQRSRSPRRRHTLHPRPSAIRRFDLVSPR